MKNFLIIGFLCCSIFLFSQIEIKIEPLKNICEKDCQIEITILNNSKFNIVIPLDKSGVKPFDNEIFWLNFEKAEILNKNLSLELLIKQNLKDDYMEAFTRIPHPPNPEFFKDGKILMEMEKKFEDNNKKINYWKEQNNIKSFRDAEKNMYLVDKLIFLEAGKKYSYKVRLENSIDLEKSPFTPTSFYLIGPNQKYFITLRLNIPKNIVKFFTKKQLKKIKNYQLFTGIVKSNEIQISYEDLSCESQD